VESSSKYLGAIDWPVGRKSRIVELCESSSLGEDMKLQSFTDTE